jgi:hypothetical protein
VVELELLSFDEESTPREEELEDEELEDEELEGEELEGEEPEEKDPIIWFCISSLVRSSGCSVDSSPHERSKMSLVVLWG